MTNSAVNSYETVGLYSALTGDHDMRAYKVVIFNSAMVSDMVSTPKDDVISDLYKRLNSVIFENKTVFSYRVL